MERDPLLVLRDVLQGKVSHERARELYRVAIDPLERGIDVNETQALRGNA